jgi:hypothetical protein
MPTTYTPRLLQSAAANENADLHLIELELIYVLRCCEKLLERNEYLGASVESSALLDSIAIRYRRCFNSGVRARLSSYSLACIQADDEGLHNFFLHFADKHVAHSVNGFEGYASAIQVGIDQGDGTIRRGGMAGQGYFAVPLSLAKISSFAELLRKLIPEVQVVHSNVTDRVQGEVDAMTDEELLALPEVIPPLEHPIPVDERRRWPKVQSG